MSKEKQICTNDNAYHHHNVKNNEHALCHFIPSLFLRAILCISAATINFIQRNIRSRPVLALFSAKLIYIQHLSLSKQAQLQEIPVVQALTAILSSSIPRPLWPLSCTHWTPLSGIYDSVCTSFPNMPFTTAKFQF
jgi:hypothetical protein